LVKGDFFILPLGGGDPQGEGGKNDNKHTKNESLKSPLSTKKYKMQIFFTQKIPRFPGFLEKSKKNQVLFFKKNCFWALKALFSIFDLW
jgi:hypothetical protein